MNIGIFTTCTRPKERGDLWDESIACYKDLADEVYINDKEWPEEFEWGYIGQTFQEGYDRIKADWVIRMDLDCIFHEKDFEDLRASLKQADEGGMTAVTFWKYQFLLPDRYTIKSRLVLAVNKARYGDRIRFDGGGDLCQATVDGEYIRPDTVPESKIPVYNYECLLKTQQQLLEDKGRFSRAWQRKFGEYKLGGPDDETAYNKWLEMMVGRFHKPQRKIKLSDHPIYIQETIKNLTPEQWGYNGFGLVEGKVYA